MKARKLKEILKYDYIYHDRGDRIAVGSALSNNMITVDKKTLKIEYALDTFKEGKKSVSNSFKLIDIWNKLEKLIESGEIKDIIEGEDELENPITVYESGDGKVIEHKTDKLGWPNVTTTGVLMYENTFFLKKEDAVADAMNNIKLREKNLGEYIDEMERKISDARSLLIELNERYLRLENEDA